MHKEGIASEHFSKTFCLFPDLTPSQFQYWASLNPSLVSLLIQNHDHVTFYTWQSKSKSGRRLGKSNPSLILDMASLNPSLILDLASLIQV